MVDLILEPPGEYHHVRSVGPDGMRIGDRTYPGPLLLTPADIRTDWPPREVSELRVEHLLAIADLQPEVALLGTGPVHRLLPRELMAEVYRLGLALEVMDTAAACRTFNVLASDGRLVAAGLMPMRRGRAAEGIQAG